VKRIDDQMAVFWVFFVVSCLEIFLTESHTSWISVIQELFRAYESAPTVLRRNNRRTDHPLPSLLRVNSHFCQSCFVRCTVTSLRLAMHRSWLNRSVADRVEGKRKTSNRTCVKGLLKVLRHRSLTTKAIQRRPGTLRRGLVDTMANLKKRAMPAQE
jgi:hypothetical protein